MPFYLFFPNLLNIFWHAIDYISGCEPIITCSTNHLFRSHQHFKLSVANHAPNLPPCLLSRSSRDSPLHGPRGCQEGAIWQTGGCVGLRSHPLHPSVRLPSFLWHQGALVWGYHQGQIQGRSRSSKDHHCLSVCTPSTWASTTVNSPFRCAAVCV